MTPPVAAAIADETMPATSAPVSEPMLLEHSYDGIREYDNPLPGWWRTLFWGSIVYAAIYFTWYQVLGWGTSIQTRYVAELADYRDGKSKRDAADVANVSEELLARYAQDPKVVAHGAEIFAVKCVACHTADGHGLIGPNLTDLYQIHGTTRFDIFQTVRGGAPGTPMLAWGEQLPPADVVAVATFATTLRGKNIPGKEPQGHPVEAFK